jgi:hypothetical protein
MASKYPVPNCSGSVRTDCARLIRWTWISLMRYTLPRSERRKPCVFRPRGVLEPVHNASSSIHQSDVVPAVIEAHRAAITPNGSDLPGCQSAPETGSGHLGCAQYVRPHSIRVPLSVRSFPRVAIRTATMNFSVPQLLLTNS